ncbi:NMDA receptor synaptonuclear signaling and neuronal migration factor-like [Mercenaria mercenaria]|uniref:NMDA receptor synaptonuclear signaling and neuronal migration factor-like n=1 Tax=Mercenaria mercenaria TaxID=6596 RepID=UPI00234ED999|nr:NMDA receptor synaptonuclear signaling and neuronal migration factor-like [Mercenaria mercenaria]
MELDRKKWVAAQHVEHLYSGDNFRPPRVVLVSSKIPKYHLLTKVYNEDIIPIIYDFDSSKFTEILDEIAKKLNHYKKNCKAKSIMVLCQGGPGYIYLLKNFAITPQKLYKPSYRAVVGFWRALAGMISKLNPQDAAIHIFGFNLTENEQGKKILPMLQSLMYPNLVKVEVVTEDTETGRAILGYYFKYSRYQVWKSYQKSSFNEIDFIQEETGPVIRHYKGPVLRVAR